MMEGWTCGEEEDGGVVEAMMRMVGVVVERGRDIPRWFVGAVKRIAGEVEGGRN